MTGSAPSGVFSTRAGSGAGSSMAGPWPAGGSATTTRWTAPGAGPALRVRNQAAPPRTTTATRPRIAITRRRLKTGLASRPSGVLAAGPLARWGCSLGRAAAEESEAAQHIDGAGELVILARAHHGRIDGVGGGR